MVDGILNLQKVALEQLTEDRLASGSLGLETEELLSLAGIYWDELGQEYFNLETFHREVFERLTQEYTSANYA